MMVKDLAGRAPKGGAGPALVVEVRGGEAQVADRQLEVQLVHRAVGRQRPCWHPSPQRGCGQRNNGRRPVISAAGVVRSQAACCAWSS